MLAKDRDQRYQTIKDCLIDLESVVRELSSGADLGSVIRGEKINSAIGSGRFTGARATMRKSVTTLSDGGPGSSIGRLVSPLYGSLKEHRQIGIVALAFIAIAMIGITFGVATINRRKSVPKNSNSRVDMVLIPGGTFQMGRDEGKTGETPPHSVTVTSFYIDRTAVTNAEYAAFLRDSSYAPPAQWTGNTPPAGQEKWQVTNVSKDDADVFAAWRSKRDGFTYRLPTEEEWEYTARNGSLDTLYPWGNNVPNDLVTGSNEPVGSHQARANYRGVNDLMGNTSEWTSSTVSRYPGNERKIPPEMLDWIVFRGGSMLSIEEGRINSATRDYLPGSKRHPGISFRLVRSSP